MIKLKPMGMKKKKTYRVIVSNKKSGFNKVLAYLGSYNAVNSVNIVTINKDELVKWLAKGVQISDRVRKIINIV